MFSRIGASAAGATAGVAVGVATGAGVVVAIEVVGAEAVKVDVVLLEAFALAD